MEPAEGYHPKTSVNFAGTQAFERKWGKAEAVLQQQNFERPSWVKTPQPGACVEKPPSPTLVQLKHAGLAAILAFSIGAACGVGLAWLLIFKRAA